MQAEQVVVPPGNSPCNESDYASIIYNQNFLSYHTHNMQKIAVFYLSA